MRQALHQLGTFLIGHIDVDKQKVNRLICEEGFTRHCVSKTFHQLQKRDLALNDETLGADPSVRFVVDVDTLVLLLPVVRGIVIHDGNEEKFVHAGQAQWLHRKAGGRFVITNPFHTELVTYLQLWFACDSPLALSTTVSFALGEKQNSFVELLPFIEEKSYALQASLGKFNGRQEALYRLPATRDAAMVFVVQGAYEVENRLLESGDGLAIWNTDRVELEALSNGAIILVLSFGVNGSTKNNTGIRL